MKYVEFLRVGFEPVTVRVRGDADSKVLDSVLEDLKTEGFDFETQDVERPAGKFIAPQALKQAVKF